MPIIFVDWKPFFNGKLLISIGELRKQGVIRSSPINFELESYSGLMAFAFKPYWFSYYDLEGECIIRDVDIFGW